MSLAPRSPLHDLSDEDLMARLRRDDADAWHEYFTRFSPLLLELAARRGVPREWCWEPVTELLDDVAERIRAYRVPAGRPLAAYLATALKHRLSNARRDRTRRERLEREVAGELGAARQAAVFSACSAYSLRAARAPDESDGSELPAVVQGFLDRLLATLGDDEQRIMGWIGERVPQREIADWMGTTHATMRKRVSRLRERALAEGRRYLELLGPEERGMLERFLGGSRTTARGAEEGSDES